MAKDTLYIEADDEITVVIDKVMTAENKVVALVLPKRATVFQSVVNMKLLKRAAKESQKHLVLISSEEAIRSIAGVAGIHVASSLNSKPEIPKAVKSKSAETTIAVDDPDAESSKMVGAAALATAVVPENEPSPGASDDDVIKMEDDEAAVADKAAAGAELSAKTKKSKFKVPDFTSFKIKLALFTAVLVLLITGWVYGFIIAPRAKVIISAETSRTTVSYEFTANAAATTADYENRVLPAKLVEITKENKVTIPTTGQKNTGEKASGKITITNCSSTAYPVDSGDQFTSGGLTFVASEAVNIPKSGYDFTGSGFECKEDGKGTVNVSASAGGANFNIAAGAHSIAGSPSNVSAYGSAMSGGTDNIVKIVGADDIKNATAQLKGSSSAEASAELKKQLTDQGQRALEQTLEEGTPAQKNSATEGAEAAEVTVTQTVIFKMLGVSEEDMLKLLDTQIQAQMKKDNVTKNVRNNGMDKLVLRLVNKAATQQQIIGVQTVATLGPSFDLETIKNDVAGKKRGDIEKLIESRDSVRSVDVVYSPGWVTTTPKSAKKITVEVNEVEN